MGSLFCSASLGRKKACLLAARLASQSLSFLRSIKAFQGLRKLKNHTYTVVTLLIRQGALNKTLIIQNTVEKGTRKYINLLTESGREHLCEWNIFESGSDAYRRVCFHSEALCLYSPIHLSCLCAKMRADSEVRAIPRLAHPRRR